MERKQRAVLMAVELHIFKVDPTMTKTGRRKKAKRSCFTEAVVCCHCITKIDVSAHFSLGTRLPECQDLVGFASLRTQTNLLAGGLARL